MIHYITSQARKALAAGVCTDMHGLTEEDTKQVVEDDLFFFFF